jgi:hypothetical protein
LSLAQHNRQELRNGIKKLKTWNFWVLDFLGAELTALLFLRLTYNSSVSAQVILYEPLRKPTKRSLRISFIRLLLHLHLNHFKLQSSNQVRRIEWSIGAGTLLYFYCFQERQVPEWNLI